MATNACKGGKVKLNGQSCKPAHELKKGDKIEVKYFSISKIYIVKDFPITRVSAKIVGDFVDDATPQEDLEKLKTDKLNKGVFRDKGLGRPTKKDRRQIGRFLND